MLSDWSLTDLVAPGWWDTLMDVTGWQTGTEQIVDELSDHCRGVNYPLFQQSPTGLFFFAKKIGNQVIGFGAGVKNKKIFLMAYPSWYYVKAYFPNMLPCPKYWPELPAYVPQALVAKALMFPLTVQNAPMPVMPTHPPDPPVYVPGESQDIDYELIQVPFNPPQGNNTGDYANDPRPEPGNIPQTTSSPLKWLIIPLLLTLS